ncbi:MAG TPA: hypothetical protein VE996_13720 [Terriglobales bacterium]|nr:hypothetical protein [Terriglobales bacterium]
MRPPLLDSRPIQVRGTLVSIARLDADDFLFLSDPEAAVRALRASRRGADLFTFLQPLPDSSIRYPYPYEMDNFAALPITTFDEWWNKQIGFKARNKAKQAAKKGVVVREVSLNEKLVEGIWEIYNETPIRQGRRFPHYGKGLDAVRRMSATFPEHSIFLGAFYGDRLIGFVKLVADQTRTQAGLMHILSLIAHREKAPTNALVAAAVRACADRGIRYLTYARYAYGRKEQSSLADFKERNGFVRMDVPRYYVPLTPWGALALRLGLHRSLKERIPEGVAAPLRSLRAAWYQRRFGAAVESA